MSYLALYREFRPQTFDQIIGQEHVVRTLVNQITTDRIGHAYLFCGARGTGKTTAAKVFARAINCLSPVNGSPCGECEVCKKLENPTNLDILEMDAASNNKVENVRDIREKVQYPPVAGKYKVYIIDEVHMLTTEAFNALLKTLEEPPAHAVFILATTEVHKIPATILSRCLRFDFKLIATDQIAKHVAAIYDEVGKKYRKEAINLIAKAGEGSVRDALSIADICVSYTQGELTYDDVLEVLGSSDRGKIEQLISYMFAGQTGEMLSVIDELCMRGKSINILNRDVCSALRDLLVVKTCKNASEILALPEDKLSEFTSLASSIEVPQILRSIEIFSTAEADLKYSTHPKIVFETAAVKASLPQADYNIDALMGRVLKLESMLASGNIPTKGSLSQEVTQKQVKPLEQEKAKEEKAEKPLVDEQKPAYSAINGTIEQEEVKQAPEKKAEVKQNVDIDEDLQSLMEMGDQMGFEDDFSQGSFIMNQPPKPVYSAINGTIESKEPVKKAQNKEQKPANQSSAAPLGDATRVWGAVLRKLRTDKEIMLWVACQDVTAQADGEVIVVIAPGENEYALLSKPENVKKLCDCVIANGFAGGVKVIKDTSELEKNNQTSENTQEIKQFFEGENLTVK
ncbi:MAG: DNA polymerase III subunit gamma/tau [Clostridia bacterium]|nr:DNA polymerase III subunit gamma/tau [Clostridia bacterium]